MLSDKRLHEIATDALGPSGECTVREWVRAATRAIATEAAEDLRERYDSLIELWNNECPADCDCVACNLLIDEADRIAKARAPARKENEGSGQ